MNGEHVVINFKYSYEFVSCGVNTYTDIPADLRSDIAVIAIVDGRPCLQGCL